MNTIRLRSAILLLAVLAPDLSISDAFAIRPGHSDLTQAISKTDPADLPDDRDFAEAAYLLRQGRKFTTAAEKLRQIPILEKQLSARQSALGCALASRAASIGFAAWNLPHFERDQDLYPIDLAEWEKAQSDRPLDSTPAANFTGTSADLDDSNPPAKARICVILDRLYAERSARLFRRGSPAPVAPILTTHDDSVPFPMTGDEARMELKRLGGEARIAFDDSLTSLPPQAPDSVRAERENARAWGLLMLWRYANLLSVIPPASPDEIRDAFRRTAALQPADPTYRQALGDALFLLAPHTYETTNASIRREALDAYQQALSRKPRNSAQLLFRIARYSTDHDIPEPDSDLVREIAVLRTLARRDPQNAYPTYYLAAALLRQATAKAASSAQLGQSGNASLLQSADGRAALTLIEDANQQPKCMPPDYTATPPPYLKAAWAYLSSDDNSANYFPTAISAETRLLCDQALREVTAGNTSTAIRALRAGIGVSANLVRGLPEDSTSWTANQKMVDSFASGIAGDCYPALVKAYQAAGDAEGENSITAERDSVMAAFQAREQIALADEVFGYGEY